MGNGRAFEFPCPDPLVFDVKVGSCVRSEQKSELARVCDDTQEFLEVDGFSCPGVGTPGAPRTSCRLIPSMLIPPTANTTSPAITTRSQTSLVVPRATCLTQRPKSASWPRKCPSVRAGTVAPRTASAATTATPTALVEPQMLKPSKTILNSKTSQTYPLLTPPSRFALVEFSPTSPLPLETQIELFSFYILDFQTRL